MTQQILITKFNYCISTEEVKKMLPAVAGKFSNIPGCQWKIWLLDEAKNEIGGLYLFNNKEELESYRKGRLFGTIVSNPAFSDFEIRVAAVAQKASAITNAPLQYFEYFF